MQDTDALPGRALAAESIVVAALAVLLVIGAVRTLRTTPLDVFPEFAPPLVEVQTEAPGLSTERRRSAGHRAARSGAQWRPGLDTHPIEISARAVIGRPDPRSVDRRVDSAADGPGEAVACRSHLPAVARPPVMLSPLSSLSRVMKIGMTSNGCRRSR